MRAVTPITGKHEGLPSNRRREIAKSVPASIRSAPTAPIGMIANSLAARSANPTASESKTTPRITGASPVRAPKRYWACKPPAPWHIGIAPKGLSSTFARPDDRARFRSFAIDPLTGKSSRDRLAVTITAFVNGQR